MDFNFARYVPVAMYSKADNVSDFSNAFKVASIKGGVSAYFIEEGIRSEDVFTVLNYDKFKERLIALENIDIKRKPLLYLVEELKDFKIISTPILYISKK